MYTYLPSYKAFLDDNTAGQQINGTRGGDIQQKEKCIAIMQPALSVWTTADIKENSRWIIRVNQKRNSGEKKEKLRDWSAQSIYMMETKRESW